MHSENEVVYLYLDDIIPNRFQPRELFDERALKELAVSIKEHGVIQPIIVRKNGEKYEIIAGERRYKAAALAGLTKIPAIIRDLDDKESSKVALLENLQRKNLNPVEEAKTYQKILEIDEMTQEELAKTMGKSQSAVANKLRLLGLSESVLNALLNGKISERHARALLSVDDKDEQDRLVKEVIQKRITVRELESLIKGENDLQKEIEKEPVPEFNSSLTTEERIDEPTPSRTEKRPPMPDTMINFDDVTSELNPPKEEVKEEKHDVKPQLVDGIDNSMLSQEDNNEYENFNEEGYKPKFINYGEIDPDLDQDDDDDEDMEKKFEFTSTPQRNLSDFNDVNNGFINHDNEPNSGFEKKDTTTSLDSLLNLKTPPKTNKRNKPIETEEHFDDDISDEEIEDDEYMDEPFEMNGKVNDLKEEQNDDLKATSTFDETLFKTPTLEDFQRRNRVSGIKANSLKPSSYKGALRDEIEDEDEEKYGRSRRHNKEKPKTMNSNIQNGINVIRDTIRSLEEQDLNIDSEEMDFENSYQIVIKIQKQNPDVNE